VCGGLDDGVVVGPGVLQAVGELVYGLEALGAEEVETDGCGAQACCDPEKVLHCGCPPTAVVVVINAVRGWLDAGEGVGIACSITLEAMDRVRFGRALGYGARHAAKTVMQAVDAASAPSAAAPAKKSEELRERLVAAPETVRRAAAGAKVAGKTAWTPVAKFSSVLWLEVTGSFFLLIAVFFGQGLWKARAAVHLSMHSHEAEKFDVYAAGFAVFAYFGVSNFVRAWRRGRR
jgi:hypothetical protein